MVFLVPIVLISLTAILIHLYFKQCYTYWKKRGLLSFPGAQMPLGHFRNPYSKSATNLGIMFEEFYHYFKAKNVKHGGAYMATTPIYIPMDLDIIKNIMTKHFDHFDEKGMYFDEERQPVTAHLFQIGGSRWKRLRVKLSPTFTSGKMKMMFPAVVKCTGPFVKSLETVSSVDIKNACGKFTTDVIGACAFGIECDSFQNTAFHHYGTKVFATDTKRAISRNIQLFCPKIAKKLGLLPFPQECVDFFVDMITDTVKMRENDGVMRNDFIQLLIELKNKPNKEEAITMKEVLSEGWLFFNAGFETSSTTMSFVMFELAKHSHIQDEVRAEVLQVMAKYNDTLTYEALSELKYMHQVIDETLRLHPPVTIINRESSQDFQVEDVFIERGTKVFIPVYSIHKDSKYYEDPELFSPDRFCDAEKRQRHPYAFLPFGEGPRVCIGMRFAVMQIKIGLATLLKAYKFVLDSSTPQELTYNKGFILSANETLQLQCHRL